MIVVDVETTGLFPNRHAIVSIGALEFEKPKNQFYEECRIDGDVAVDSGALRVNGFTLEQIQDVKKPTLVQIAKKFLVWSNGISDKTLGGHNTGFDASFLRAAVTKLKKSSDEKLWPFGHRLVDMHSIAYAQMKRHKGEIPLKYDTSAIYSDSVHQFCGLPEEPMPHHGLTGAKMEAEAMSRLIYGKNLLPEYKKFEIPEYLKS